MAKDNELVIRINGNIKGYQDALKKAEKETEDLQKTFNAIAKTGAIAFAGFVGAIALTTARFAEFDQGLRGVKTLLDESSFSAKSLDKGFQDLSKGALDALTDFPLTLQSINKSLFDIVSAGVPAANAIEVLGSTSRLSVAGITDSAVATDGVTSALNAYGLEAKEAELVAAKFFTAQKFGKTTVEELSNFFGRAAATASSYGVSLDELLAATAAMTTGGIKTAAAMAAIPAIMANIAKPTEEAKEEAERLGIEFTSTALRAKGLTGFLDSLTNAQGFNQQSVEKLFGSIEAQKGIFSLTGAQADKYKETLNELTDSQKLLTTFQEAYETQSKSLTNQVTVLTNNFDALGILIGKNLAPLVEELAGIMTEFLRFLQDNPGIADFIAKMLIAGTVTAALALGVGGLGLGLLKMRAAMIAATIATRGLSFAAKALIGSTGIGLLIAFLPEIIELIERFFGDTTDAARLAAGDQKKVMLQQARDEKSIAEARTRGLSEIEIDFLMRQQDLRRRAAAAEKIKDEDVKRIKLRTIKLQNEQLFKEEREFAGEQQKLQVESGEKSVSTTKKITDSKVQAIMDENERIRAALSDQEKDEIAFLARRQEIAKKQLAAEKEQDATRRAFMLENVRLLNEQVDKEEEVATVKRAEKNAKELQDLQDKNEALFFEEAESILREDELHRIHEEAEAAIQQEIAALSTEQRQALQQAEIDELIQAHETKAKIESKAAKKALLEKRKEDALFLKDQQIFGDTLAGIRAFFRSEEVNAADVTSRQLVQLQNDENAAFQAIGKAAALVQIAISTERGAMAAIAAFAKFGPTGIIAGNVAAGVIVAAGARSAQKVAGFADGGRVPGIGFQDTQLAMLTPNELIVPPQNFEEVLSAVADQRSIQREAEESPTVGISEDEEAAPIRIEVDYLTDEAADIITVTQNEQDFLGISQRNA